MKDLQGDKMDIITEKARNPEGRNFFAPDSLLFSFLIFLKFVSNCEFRASNLNRKCYNTKLSDH